MTREPARVLMLTKGLGRGGTERLLVGTVRHLDRARFDVEVAYLLPHKDAFVEEIRAAGVWVHCLDAPQAVNPTWLGRLRRLVRERDIDLVHTHMPLTAAWARLALRGSRPVFVHTEHNMWDRYRWPTRRLNALTYRRNAAVIAVSQGVADSIRSKGVPVEVVTHGIDIGEAMGTGSARYEAMGAGGRTTLPRSAESRPLLPRQARAALGLPDDVPVVGSVGNFTAKKDHASLLDAFAQVRADHPDSRLVLVGLGPLEDAVRRQADQLGLGDAVLFTGRRDDVEDILPAFDVFTLSSRYEGLPIALLEAMAAGIAPVATHVGGIPEVLTHEHDGLLVDPGDPQALADAISRLLADPDVHTRIAGAAQTRAADFDIATAVRRIESIYEAALNRAPVLRAT